MIRIGICDDELNIAENVNRLVKDYFDRSGLSYSSTVFNNPVELSAYLEEKGGFDILILDIYMPMILGTEVAKTLRNRGDQTRIIFLTTSTNHAIDAFAVRASDYILKPLKEDSFERVFDEITAQLQERDNRIFVVKTGEGIVNLKYSNIAFVELRDRRMAVHSLKGDVIQSKILRGNFEEGAADLISDPVFVQCQKSFVVNMNQVKTMNSKMFTLRDGTEIPISKKFYQETKKKYMEFLLREEI